MTPYECIGRHDNDNRPERDVGFLCGDCFSRMRRQLVELPAITIWLEAHIAAGGVAGEKVSGSKDEPIPLRLDVLDLVGPDSLKHAKPADPPFYMLWHEGIQVGYYKTWREAKADRTSQMREWGDDPDDKSVWAKWQIRSTARGGSDQLGDESVRATVAWWSKLAHEENGKAWPDNNDLPSLVNYLASLLIWIANQQWVDEFIAEIESLGKRARGVVPWQEETKREKDERCDNCGMTAMVNHIAMGIVRCEKRLGGCGRQRVVSDYEFSARHVTEAS